MLHRGFLKPINSLGYLYLIAFILAHRGEEHGDDAENAHDKSRKSLQMNE